MRRIVFNLSLTWLCLTSVSCAMDDFREEKEQVERQVSLCRPENTALETIAAAAIGGASSFLLVKGVTSWVARPQVSMWSAITAAGIGTVFGFLYPEVIWAKNI
jgi:TPP-dependent indolepyruvate ferredoxin oxidoreductase alpha subunit